MSAVNTTQFDLLAPGHRACPGCGTAIVARLVLMATGPNVIVVTATGCLETFTSPYQESAWNVPWIHPLFENAASVASGVQAALEVTGRTDTKVVVFGGDGSTFDIGLGALSGLFERNHDLLYVCYDNEAYMNTGVQRSSATPEGADTTTSPVGSCQLGKQRPKKNLPAIAMAHDIPYVATASIAYPRDVINKVKKALSITGTKYLQIDSPCCIGWGFDPAKTVEVARLAVETGIFPVWEAEHGKPIKARKIRNRRPVEDFLKLQRRFRHLFDLEEGKADLQRIQKLADENAARYGLDDKS